MPEITPVLVLNDKPAGSDGLIDQLVAEAFLLGLPKQDLMKLIQERIREHEERIHDNDKRTDEKLR